MEPIILEFFKYETGDGTYVEVEITENLRSKIANLRRETQFEEAEGELTFVRNALAELDRESRLQVLEDGGYVTYKENFEKACAQGRNCMRFLQELYRWDHLQYHVPTGEWTLYVSWLRRPDGSERCVSLWPRPSGVVVEINDEQV